MCVQISIFYLCPKFYCNIFDARTTYLLHENSDQKDLVELYVKYQIEIHVKTHQIVKLQFLECQIKSEKIIYIAKLITFLKIHVVYNSYMQLKLL